MTDIKSILKAIKPVLEKHPKSKAGVTLANTFPSLAFKPGPKVWEDGVVVGISGEGITPTFAECIRRSVGFDFAVPIVYTRFGQSPWRRAFTRADCPIFARGPQSRHSQHARAGKR